MNTLFVACLTCAKAFEHAGGNAAGWAIFFMLFILVLVLGTVAYFMFRMARRASEHADDRYQDTFHGSIQPHNQ